MFLSYVSAVLLLDNNGEFALSLHEMRSINTSDFLFRELIQWSRDSILHIYQKSVLQLLCGRCVHQYIR